MWGGERTRTTTATPEANTAHEKDYQRGKLPTHLLPSFSHPMCTPVAREHSMVLTSQWNGRPIMYLIITEQASFSATYTSNESQIQVTVSLGRGMLDAGFGSMRRGQLCIGRNNYISIVHKKTFSAQNN